LENHAATIQNSFAHRYNCDRLIYVEQFVDYMEAIQREKQLKSWRRSKKVALIARVNPRWEPVEAPDG
jgi:putative endonuclease